MESDPNELRDVADNPNQLQEPLCIYVPFMDPSDPVIERGPFKSVFRLVAHVPLKDADINRSQGLNTANLVEGLTIKASDEHLLEVYFSSEKSPASSKDFRPDLPLIFHF